MTEAWGTGQSQEILPRRVRSHMQIPTSNRSMRYDSRISLCMIAHSSRISSSKAHATGALLQT
jgi:hypothetical protein